MLSELRLTLLIVGGVTLKKLAVGVIWSRMRAYALKWRLKHRGKSRHIIYIPTTNVWLNSRQTLNILSISCHRTCIPSADVLVKIRGSLNILFIRHRTCIPSADVLVKIRGSMNIVHIVTELVSQAQVLLERIETFHFVTELVSQVLMSWLKSEADMNILVILVTEDVSQSPMSWLKLMAEEHIISYQSHCLYPKLQCLG